MAETGASRRSEDGAAPRESAAPGRAGDVLARLRFDILSLRLAPGEPLSERRLEESYAASRTPIRAALSRLEEEGLVARQGRTPLVAPLDPTELAETFEFRDAVEPAALRLACARATPTELDAVQALIDTGRAHFDPESWIELGLDFHVRLAELSGNRMLGGAMRDITRRTLRARWLAVTLEEGRGRIHTEHSAILAHVRAGDAEAAVAASRRHAAEVRDEVMRALETSRPILGRRSFAAPAAPAVPRF